MPKVFKLLIILTSVLILIGCTENPLATNVIKKKTDTTKEVNNGNLPADPGEAGKKTLEGIDSDKDGLRDDIQIFIHKKYGKEPKDYQNAIRQLALIMLEEQRVGAREDDLNEIKVELFNRLNYLSRAALLCLEIMNYAYYKNQTDLERSLAMKEIIDATLRIVDNTEERFKATKKVSTAMAGGSFGGNLIAHFNDCDFKIEIPLVEQKKVQKAFEDELGEEYMEEYKHYKRYFKDEQKANSESGAETEIKMNALTNTQDNLCNEKGSKELSIFHLNGMGTSKYDAERDSMEINKIVRKKLGIDKETLKKIRRVKSNYVDSYSTRNEHKLINHPIFNSVRPYVHFILNFIELFLQLYFNRATLPNIDAHNTIYNTAIESGEKVIMLAYSKGSIYANRSYSMMGAKNRYMKIISIGAVVSSIAGNGKYITYKDDTVINFFRGFIQAINTGGSLPLPYAILKKSIVKIMPIPIKTNLPLPLEGNVNVGGSEPELNKKFNIDYLMYLIKNMKNSHAISRYINDKGVQQELSNNIKTYKNLPSPKARIKYKRFGIAMNAEIAGDMDLHILEPNKKHINYMNDTGLGKLEWNYMGGTENYNIDCNKIEFGGKSSIEIILGAVYDGIEGMSLANHKPLMVEFAITIGDKKQVFNKYFPKPTALGNGLTDEEAKRLNEEAHRKPTWVAKVIIKKVEKKLGKSKYKLEFENIK